MSHPQPGTSRSSARSVRSSSAPATRRSGAHVVQARRHGLGWLPWLLLGLLALLALGIWALVNGLDDDGDDAVSTATTAVARADVSASAAPATAAPGAAATTVAAGATPPASTPPGGVAPGAGTAGPLIASGQDVLAVAGDPAALAALQGTTASGSATVESVVSDEGFWIGTSPQDRVFVFITEAARGTSGESPFQVAAGQVVNLTATVQPIDGLVPADLDAADGRAQLESQGVLLAADQLQLVG